MLFFFRYFSFGRGVSHDDDGAHSDYEVATSSADKSHIMMNKNHALWSSRPGLVSADTGKWMYRNAVYHNGALIVYCLECGSDLEDAFTKSPQASPAVKKKGHWGKVLMKAKRETTPAKQPQSFQSLASVSMMMLPTITVAGSSPTLVILFNYLVRSGVYIEE